VPGNGALVGVVVAVTGQQPLVAGKPDPAMHAECVRRTGARRPLVVGDRLDTDIEGARRAGAASMLVLTGVCQPAELLAAGAHQRPDLIAPDAAGLLVSHPATAPDGPGWRCGAWSARPAEGEDVLVLAADRAAGPTAGAERPDDGLDGLRALCVAHWARHPDDGATVTVVAADPRATEALSSWGLTATG
jgi:hypothetical protein